MVCFVKADRQRFDADDDESERGSLGETVFMKRCKAGATMINEKTSLPFKILVPLCTLLILCTWKIGQGFSQMNRSIENTWTITHQEEWARQMRKGNPTLSIPDAREIFEERPNKTINLVSH